jgi:hypothetical protein
MTYPSKGAIFYTNNILDDKIFNTVLDRLKELTVGMEVVSVSHKPVDFGRNIVVDLPSGKRSIVEQINIGLQASTADVVYLVEHDVLYHPSHFKFIPKGKEDFCYNTNVWQLDVETGKALFRKSKRTSQLVVYREALLGYFEIFLEHIKKRGYRNRFGIAPLTHANCGVEKYHLKVFKSEYPNIDIRHKDNFTNFVRTDEVLVDEVPGWGKTKDIITCTKML